MATTAHSPRRWPRSLAAYLLPRGGDTLLYALAVLSILSLLTHELTRRSVLAADFEGFEAEEDEEEYLSHQQDLLDITPVSPLPTPLFPSTPESHHGPPDSLESPPEDGSVPPPPAQSAPERASPSKFEEWDEDEFEGIPAPVLEEPPSAAAGVPLPDAAEPPKPAAPATPASFPRSYGVEIACVSFLIAFIFNYFSGKKENENIALAWAAKFATKDTVFERNFSLLGTGDGKDTPLLLKEGQDAFKFYASGRRFCQRLLATMELRPRHDLIARILDLVFPKRDTITFEVIMNEDAMDHLVFAVARKKLARTMQKDERDLQRYASLLATPPAGRKWLPEELTVVSESKEVAGDLITEAVLDQVFGDKAFEKFGKGFISLHFSDQYPGPHKRMLIFKFLLPDAKNMVDMTRLVTLVPYYIDLIGRYKLSPQARTKTEAARAKAAQEAYRELQNARQEALLRKKAEKKKQMEPDTKLSAEAIRKKEEKDRTRQMKKGMPRMKMLRGH
ncbi:hypothetical protein Taro_005102 [Colocasia esculenta]|uniref:Coiled-coil domain-containing protein 47 n=1 Tax=Colocasia esculenta TaxID=4460 RepID=A0A843TM59_COLES|nr:hypothetical protein [Colocasia esculenta]